MMIENAAAAGRSSSPTGNRNVSGCATFDVDVAKQAREASDLKEALAAFKAEARKTPRERCRDQVMKEWHITKEQIDNLPPREAQAMNNRIEQEVSRRMQTEGTRSDKSAAANEADGTPPEVASPPATEAPSTLQVLSARAQSVSVLAPALTNLS